MKTIKRSISTFGLLALAGYSFTAHALQALITDSTGTQGAGGDQAEFSWAQDLAFGVLRTTDDDSPKNRTDSVTAGLTWRF